MSILSEFHVGDPNNYPPPAPPGTVNVGANPKPFGFAPFRFTGFGQGNSNFGGVRFGPNNNAFGQSLIGKDVNTLGTIGYGQEENAVTRDAAWGQFLAMMKASLAPTAYEQLARNGRSQYESAYQNANRYNPATKFADVLGSADVQGTWDNLSPGQAGRSTPFFGTRW